MLDFLRGQKESIRRLCGGLELELEFYHKAPLEIDVGCFGLDDAGTRCVPGTLCTRRRRFSRAAFGNFMA